MAAHVLLGVVVAAGLLAGSTPARAEVPEPGQREQEWSLQAAHQHFEAGRFEEALAHFEAAGREGPVPLPPAALLRWGLAASEAGWPLAALVRLRQYRALVPDAAGIAALEGRIARAREALLQAAPRRSRVVTAWEPRGGEGEGARRQVVRLVARDGQAVVEAPASAPVPVPRWERLGEMALEAYLGLLGRLLEAPVLAAEPAREAFDPDRPGPPRAVVVHLVVGDEERRLEAPAGAPSRGLREVAGWVLELARRAAGARIGPGP